ncbi:MAG: phosphopentomutase [Deltaproteobacteria bacterium]
MNRVVLIVLDSAGVGELPDAAEYGDCGSNTIGNIARYAKDFELKNMRQLGLGLIPGAEGIGKTDLPIGCFGRMAEKSKGKDTTTGHWEISGVTLDKAFPTYPDGFPKDLMERFEELIGTRTLGNKPASGTAIIDELGDEHVKTGFPIVYTSADSVFQIAAHEEIISIDRLYEICEIARKLLQGEHGVGRVIARPFEGKSGEYKRTERRKDYSLEPTGKTMLDAIKENGFEVAAVGKIEDIFAFKGITKSVHTHNNREGVNQTIEYIKESFKGVIFTNLVDFDMVYGHRNDVQGYANALMEFDSRLPEIMDKLKNDDLLIITADHGCDPTTPSTDHSREYVPLVVYGKGIKKGVNLGSRSSFADISAAVLELLGINPLNNGISFAKEII